MTVALTPNEVLFAEVTALHRIVQRLVAQMAVGSGHDLTQVMRAEHAQATAELAKTDFGLDSDRVDAVRSYAQSILDDIYSMGTTFRRGP